MTAGDWFSYLVVDSVQTRHVAYLAHGAVGAEGVSGYQHSPLVLDPYDRTARHSRHQGATLATVLPLTHIRQRTLVLRLQLETEHCSILAPHSNQSCLKKKETDENRCNIICEKFSKRKNTFPPSLFSAVANTLFLSAIL